MKHSIYILIGLVTSALLLSSCGGETYTEKLKKEEKAINRFFDLNDIKLIYEYPKDGIFAENEFFKEPTTGVYFHVIDPGNDERPSKEKRTEIYLRYDTIYNLLTNEVESDPNWLNASPTTFRYGVASTYTSSDYYTAAYYILSQGCVVPLDYGLGNKAEIKLLIPFENGATAQQSAYKPIYYSRLQYSFVIDKPQED
ncbi:MAG: DUF4827 domain-containing protein [Prevotella sp.]|jgi:hypothetical protein|nr:DUF4827 domain-containing protein [Prevotella sp.]